MALRIAIVGPGRVGTALARALRGTRAELLGFVARRPAAAEHLLREQGRGRVLGLADLRHAHVVVFSVGDADLASAVADATADGVRRCSLWLHTSGLHGLDVLQPAAQLGVRTGSLHPLCPFPAGGDALATMRGAPALLQGEPRSLRLLRRLCGWLQLEPIICGEQDRALYHAACALAANGATALFALVEEVLLAAGGLSTQHAHRIAGALGAAAGNLTREHGAAGALSGPVRRGDADTVAAHVASLARGAPQALPIYRLLMRGALELACAEGLPSDRAGLVADRLEDAWPS